MAGHSRSKNGVLSHAYVPAIATGGIRGRFDRVCAATHFSHSFNGTPDRPGQISAPL
jgi:hypothetical protein